MGATMGRPPETRPSYREAQVLLVISPTGTTQVNIGLRLDQKMSTGDVSVYINRLQKKGLVKIIGTVKQPKNGRYSRIVAPTDRGKEVILALQKRGVK